METGQASFEGWGIVEMMGHRREIGYITTEHYGAASLFRVDTPGVDGDKETITKRPGYAQTDQGYIHLPAGSVVKLQPIPPRSVLVGPGSIYALNPCTEEVAREAILQQAQGRPLILLSMPEVKSLPEKSEGLVHMDVVCGNEVDEGGEFQTAEFKGNLYYFCSRDCKEEFEETPQDYINA